MADLVKSESPLRGEITATLGGKERKLRLTIEQLETIEDETGIGAVDLFERFVNRKHTTRQLRLVLAEALRKTPEHPRPDLKEVWNMVISDKDGYLLHHLTAGSLLAAALGFGLEAEEDKNPPEGGSE